MRLLSASPRPASTASLPAESAMVTETTERHRFGRPGMFHEPDVCGAQFFQGSSASDRLADVRIASAPARTVAAQIELHLQHSIRKAGRGGADPGARIVLRRFDRKRMVTPACCSARGCEALPGQAMPWASFRSCEVYAPRKPHRLLAPGQINAAASRARLHVARHHRVEIFQVFSVRCCDQSVDVGRGRSRARSPT